MTTALARTIHLNGPLGHKEELVIASGQTIYPGMLILKTSAGEASAHATAGGSGFSLLVHEDEYQGSAGAAPTNGVASAYTAGNPCFAHYCQSGSLKYVRLLASETVVVGTHLISDGTGRLKATTGTPAKVYAIAEEASAAVGTDNLIKARFL